MTSEDPSDSGRDDGLEPIPEEIQDISTEELVEADYGVPSSSSGEKEGPPPDHRNPPPAIEPGEIDHPDSVSASSPELGEDDDRDAYTVGYDSSMATRIGDEGSNDGDAKRLRELHEGRHRSDGQHSTREHHRDKKRIRQAICSSLPLTEREEEKVANVVEGIDFSRFGQHRALERVILGVVVVVVDEQRRQDDPDMDEFVLWSDEFREICESLDISMSDLSSIKENVREALDSETFKTGPRRPRRDPALPGPASIDERPRRYWDSISAKRWIEIAQLWEKVPDEAKEALPDNYRELVERLQQRDVEADDASGVVEELLDDPSDETTE